MPTKLLITLLIALGSLNVRAEPAPWYWWASKLDGARVCQQTSPGNGWYRAGGPYRNGRCNDFSAR